MRLPFLAVLFAAALATRASHHRDVLHKIKESIQEPPAGWVIRDAAPSEHVLRLKIALSQPHFRILEQHLWEVSDPDHERYGAYLSKEEINALMAPHPRALDAVSAWLSSYGIKAEDLYWSSAQDWVTIHVPVVLAEEMLNTKYHVYTHLGSGESIVRTTNYSLPESLHEHVELIQPTTMFNRLYSIKNTLHWSNKRSSEPSSGTITGPAGNQVDASCNGTITMTCLRQLYNAVGYNTSATNGNKIAVSNYLEQYANNEDLQQFYRSQNPAAYGSNYTFISVNGGLNNQSKEATGWEGNLDTQIAFGLTYPTTGIYYSTRGSPPFIPGIFTPSNDNEPYSDWLDYVSSQEDLPQTISTSYSDYEQTVPYSYANRVCSGFAALGARGISVIFSSGNSGIGGGGYGVTVTPQCFSNDGTNRTMFLPTFPNTCPYVTAVGGTTRIPEMAADFSGGGFSNYFAQPSYQRIVVTKYLEKLVPGTYNGLYNPNGRAYPDVAAQADEFLIVYKGEDYHIWGTSCAAPTFASIVAMLNDARINAGKFPMGFINPWLYTRGRAGLNDITVGNNPGCNTTGFNATIGWDPVSGLGTPNLRKLLELAIGNHY